MTVGCIFTLLSCLLFATTTDGWAANSITIESKTVRPGDQNVEIHIKIENDFPLFWMNVPLKMRTRYGNTYITQASMRFDERLSNSSILENHRNLFFYPDSTAAAACPYEITERQDGTGPVAISLNTAGFQWGYCAAPPCPPSTIPLEAGADATGSLVLTVDIDTLAGEIVLDETCLTSANGGPLFGDNLGRTEVPVIVPGIIRVVSPAETLYVDSTTGDDANPGTISEPVATIQQAMMLVNRFADRSTILVGPGTYHGSIAFEDSANVELIAEEGAFVTHIVGDSSGPAVTMATISPSLAHVIEGFTVRDNVCDDCGAAGILVGDSTHASVLNCIIQRNEQISTCASSSASNAAGVSAYTGSAGGINYNGRGGVIAGNWIVDNVQSGCESFFGAGGLYVALGATVEVINNTIARNVSEAPGSGVYVAGSGPPEVISAASGTLTVADSVVSLANNVIAFNAPYFGVFIEPGAIVDTMRSSVMFENEVDVNPEAEGLIDTATFSFKDPMFADTAAGDYHLACGSSALDLGIVEYVPPDLSHDIDGEDRLGFDTNRVDAGGDERYDTVKTADFALADLSDTLGCPPHVVAFHNFSECLDEEWIWDFGDGVVDTGFGQELREPEHQYDSPGTYSVTLIAQNGLAADTLVLTDYIVVLDNAKPTLSVSDPGCAPTEIDLSVALSGAADSILWVFDDGDSLAIEGPLTSHDTSHVYADTGHFRVTVLSYSGCGVLEDTATVVVGDDIAVVITSTYDTIPPDERPVCSPLEVTFGVVSAETIIDYLWHFGDGDSSTVAAPTHEYVEGGNYIATLIVTSDCGVDTFTYNDTIQVVSDARIVNHPVATPTISCPGDSVTFFVDLFPDPDSILWEFGDGETSALTMTKHAYAVAGQYVPTLTIWDGCGTETLMLQGPDTLTVGTSPVASFTSSADSLEGTECAPLQVRFHSNVSGDVVGYSWDFGDGGSSNLANPIHTFLNAGTYDVTLIANGPCGADTVTSPAHVTLIGAAEFVSGPSASAQEICAGGDSIEFSITVIPAIEDSATWLFGDGESATGLTAKHRYGVAGIYIPQFVYRHACGVDTLTLAGDNDSIIVKSFPNTAFGFAPDSGYAPLTVQFTDETPNNPGNWNWTFDDGLTSSQSAPSHTYTDCGEYEPTLSVTNECGSMLATSIDHPIRVGDFDMSSQIIGTTGDSRVYRVDVDECVFYHNSITLTAQLESTPIRGSVVFDFDIDQGTPPFSADMTAIPIGGLATGEYTIRITATDLQRGISRTSTHLWDFEGVSLLEFSPAAMTHGETVVDSCAVETLCVRNSAQPRGSDSILTILGITSNNPDFHVRGATSASLAPGDSVKWEIEFCPTSMGGQSATITINSDDPVTRQVTFQATGTGIAERTPPYVFSATPDSVTETTIDDVLRIVISEEIQSPDPIEEVMVVKSLTNDAMIHGTISFERPDTLTFTPDGFLPVDDTLLVTVDADLILDLAGNSLDGNNDGEEQGAPDDNFSFTFYTGPGVYPGDTDNDGIVNETDVLPLGRYYKTEGFERVNPQPGFTLQPARAWPVREMTYADANGDGVIDSMDICPIADYFDMSVELPKSVVEQWLNESAAWGDEVVGALLAALEHCPGNGQGHSVLKTFLEGSLQSPVSVPESFELAQNYPNPFNPVTVIEYALSEPTHVSLRIYDIQGQLIRVLRDQSQEPGRYRAIWDGRDQDNQPVASGVYFYRLETPSFSQVRKMVLLK
ncbi:MAG: hypothetical protein Kow0074_12510 [Candidatus Zixiibacteriota bacterium]